MAAAPATVRAGAPLPSGAIEQTVAKGRTWLVSQQHGGGSWRSGRYGGNTNEGPTSLALLALANALLGVEYGCRTRIIYAPPTDGVPQEALPSLSCLWEFGGPSRELLAPEVRREVEAALAIGVNVLAYATDRKVKRKDELFAVAGANEEEPPPDPIDRGRIAIATLEHTGMCDAAPPAWPTSSARRPASSASASTIRRPGSILVTSGSWTTTSCSCKRRGPPKLEGVRIGNRWAVIFSPDDLSCALEQPDTMTCAGYGRDDAEKIALNVLLSSFNHE